MNKINLLYAYHAGANCKYFETMLQNIAYYEAMIGNKPTFAYKIVRPPEFVTMDTDAYNVLVYQTFPDQHNQGKFSPQAINELDSAFCKFQGFKILLDSFDMGDYNGYERFGDGFPRIKHVPSYNYLKKFDVVSMLCTTGWSHEKYSFIPPEIKRDAPIHCAFTTGVYPHNIRERIIQILKEKYVGCVSFDRIPMDEYDEFLRKVQISIVAPGFGETSGSAYPTLQSGALLFVHEKIKEVKLFPFVDLVDGEDYISFNLDNFIDKLDWILFKDDKADRIKKSGQKKFFEGFDPERSAKEFLEYLQINM